MLHCMSRNSHINLRYTQQTNLQERRPFQASEQVLEAPESSHFFSALEKKRRGLATGTLGKIFGSTALIFGYQRHISDANLYLMVNAYYNLARSYETFQSGRYHQVSVLENLNSKYSIHQLNYLRGYYLIRI